MTLLTCKSFRASPLPTGEIQLEIETPQEDAPSSMLNLQEVAELLGKSVKAVDRLSRRRKDPLPIHRGKGRPYALRYELDIWLTTDPVKRTMLEDSARFGASMLKVFGHARVASTRRRTAHWVDDSDPRLSPTAV